MQRRSTTWRTASAWASLNARAGCASSSAGGTSGAVAQVDPSASARIGTRATRPRPLRLDLAEPMRRALSTRLVSFRQQLLSRRRQLALLLLRDLGRLQTEVADRAGQDVRHHGPRHPLVVGGNHVPRRPVGARRAERVLEGLGVLVPVSAFREVRGRELPVLLLVLEALQEALLLLLLG